MLYIFIVMEKLIELKSIYAGYNHKVILNDINLTIYKNDFLGVIGPNGGGKTTLLKIILGLIKPYQGKIIYNNGDVSSKKNIGYLPQIKNLDSRFPILVKDVVLSGLLSQKRLFRSFKQNDHKQAIDLLDTFGVAHLGHKPIGELSGGQMQRVYLCRALISSPNLLVLDEPDTYVDQNFSRDLNEILVELNKKMAIVMVSHDIGSVLTAVKNIACVNYNLHYHNSQNLPEEIIDSCQCNFRLVEHGDVPHTVLQKHIRKDK